MEPLDEGAILCFVELDVFHCLRCADDASDSYLVLLCRVGGRLVNHEKI